MAKRDVTPSDRNLSRRPSSEATALHDDSKPDSALEALERTVEDERLRLLKAHSILSCATLAMEVNAESQNKRSPYYPAVIDLAADLLNEAIERLDSVNLQPPLSDMQLFGRRRGSA
ncbi:MAG TPA: hypothetical protein VF329_15720 [Gammaproteobacteria bacterium]